MPSYADSPSVEKEIADRIKTNPEEYLQIKWDNLYQANRMNKLAGIGKSSYILNSVVEYSKKLNFAMNLESALTNHITFIHWS
jgi:hypothetical protein